VPVIAAAIITAAFIIYLINDYRDHNQRALNRSIEVVGNMLDPEYTILAEHLEDSVPDSAGAWIIKSKVDLEEKLGVLPQFTLADKSDEEYYKREFFTTFRSVESLDGYALYRASFPLGKGTICSTDECNLYVLVKPGASKAFITIFVV